MKIGVIGTGPSGLGTLHSLLRENSSHSIILFDIGKEFPESPLHKKPPNEWSIEDHRMIRETTTKGNTKKPWIPTVTHFGFPPERYRINKKFSVWKSDQFGGLLNYWSSSIFPFTEHDFEKWPIKLQDLKPYYQEVADLVGISGNKDQLNSYFVEDFINRPPIRCSKPLAHLRSAIEAYVGNSQYRVIAGINRLGIETRPDELRSCVYCGECFNGCFRESVFGSKRVIHEHISKGRVHYVRGKVLRVKRQGETIEIQTVSGVHSGFDKVFLGAGCPGTSEIILRSFEKIKELHMVDNDSYVFPIINLKLSHCEENTHENSYMSIANLVVGCVPQQKSGYYSQAHLSPLPDSFLRYHLPERLWKYAEYFGSMIRRHIFFGKLYLHSDISRSYLLRLDGQSRLTFDIAPATARKKTGISSLLREFRKAIKGSGFSIPPFPVLLTKTSSHYAGTLPYGKFVSKTGEIDKNIYISDSSTFPASPAQPLTFTIMANAARISREAFL